MMQKTCFLIVLIFAAAAGLFFQGNGLEVSPHENQGDKNLEIGLWTPDTTIEQTFIASRNHLARLDVAFDSYHPWNSPYLLVRLFEIHTRKDPHELTYHSMTQNMTEVRSMRVNGWLLTIHAFNRFSFDPIPDSQEKRYLLSIQSPELKYGGSSILLASPEERYENGNLFVDGERQDGDLSFRALYEMPRTHILHDAVERLTRYKPFPFSHPLAYYLPGIMYILLLGSLLCLVVGREKWTKTE